MLVSTAQPEQILLLRGNMPLIVLFHEGLRVLVYASEAAILERGIGGVTGWEPMALPAYTCVVVDTCRLPNFTGHRFIFG
ncbi:MAG TPA: hypothetical protein VGL77_20185 [Armatimonadota bacterium]